MLPAGRAPSGDGAGGGCAGANEDDPGWWSCRLVVLRLGGGVFRPQGQTFHGLSCRSENFYFSSSSSSSSSLTRSPTLTRSDLPQDQTHHHHPSTRPKLGRPASRSLTNPPVRDPPPLGVAVPGGQLACVRAPRLAATPSPEYRLLYPGLLQRDPLVQAGCEIISAQRALSTIDKTAADAVITPISEPVHSREARVKLSRGAAAFSIGLIVKMVLFKRKPVQFLPTPEIADDDQEVWVIDATGEIFTEYDDYLARMHFYKSKRFICEITGHSGLDFFSAQESELAGSKDVEESFPDALKAPILRKVQFQTIPRIDNLVDLIYDFFKNDFFPGEHIIATLHNSDRTEGQIREKISFPEQKNAQGDVLKPAHANYTVSLVNRGTEITLSGDELSRDRRIFTKAMLRAFVKNTVHREAWNGAPWLVKDWYAKKYCITQAIPKHLQRGSTVAERKAMLAVRKAQAEQGFSLTIAGTGPKLSPDPTPEKPTKGNKGKKKETDGRQSLSNLSSASLKVQPVPEPPKPPPRPIIKYPIEDLTIMPSATLRKRPTLKRLHEVTPGKKLSEDSVPILLETWVFLNVYCEPFLLDSFTFDDYIEALFYNDDHQDCTLLVELHCSMLKALVDEGQEGKVKIASILDLDTDSEDADDEEENEEDLPVQTRRSSARFKESRISINGHGDNQNPMWLELLRKRDFREGGWETIIVGLFGQISRNTQFKSLATDILRYFSPLAEETVLLTAKAQYKDLDINTKIKIIQLLQKLTFETPIVRNYMEECGEAMTKLRKDKIEHQKARKIFIEELKSLEDERRQLLPDNEPSSPLKDGEMEIDRKTSNGYDTPEVDNDGEDSDSSRPTRRQPSNRAAERKRKREQEKEKEEANAKLQESMQKYKRACLSVEKARAKIRQEEAAIAELDGDLRESDCARLRLLGRDRFWNRYWFFERNGMPYAGLPSSSTADSGYAMGRLWLQGASPEEQKEFLDSDRVVNNDTNDGTKVSMSIKERRKKEEGNAALRGPEKWAYIDEQDDLQALMDWLDVRGERELKLKKELELYKEHMSGAMESRRKYLSPDSRESGEVVVRMSTRTKSVAQVPVQRCLKWKNNLAIQKMGHLHSELPAKPKGRKQDTRSSRNISRAR
ncbi:hypothetical protein DRE_03771 [Drechslerella stenobrocha 248]|uniref:DDT domain-containing protein n=1 Tax=Drechslerella stenobrocha 248 TaxID=1043628 RepID=W7HU80_9PEZI|nr:hypothetical protein DRE_03771 [Drechslerella stenobrocha 248]